MSSAIHAIISVFYFILFFILFFCTSFSWLIITHSLCLEIIFFLFNHHKCYIFITIYIKYYLKIQCGFTNIYIYIYVNAHSLPHFEINYQPFGPSLHSPYFSSVIFQILTVPSSLPVAATAPSGEYAIE